MRSQRFHRQAKRAVHCLTRAWYATSNFFKEVWRGDADEPQKIILHRDLGHVLRRFLIHLLPLGATIVLAYFNFAGYFIGNNFQGRTGEEYQALDLLCLQVAAKLLELLIVASLGTIVLDVIRTQLVFGSSGLPLGLLSSKQSFPQVQYLLSPEFRFGLGGLTIRKRLLFGLLILTSTVIALLAGPSAALLMIPTRKDSWPAGAASIWLKGDESTLWPSKVTGDDIGGPVCESPGSQVLTSYQLNFSGCVWAGSPYLAAAFRQIHFNIPRQLSIDDGLLKRDMIIRQRGDVHDTHVLTSHLSAGILSKLAGNRWYDALLHTHHSSKHYTLRYRARNLTMGITQSWLPAVRTRCRLNDPLSQNGSDVLMYPATPEYDIVQDLDYNIRSDYTLSPNISTRWVSVPPEAPISNGSVTTDLPSAFLNIQVPQVNNLNGNGCRFSCSVDARWAMGTDRGGPVGLQFLGYQSSAAVNHIRRWDNYNKGFEANFLPKDDGTWRRIRIEPSWLQALTPALSIGNSEWTSLAAILTDMHLDNSTGLIDNWFAMTVTIETLIASLVADGLSRQGLNVNGGSLENFWDAENLLPWNDPSSDRDRLLDGNFEFPQPAGAATKLRWVATVSGYAYKADSTASYLSLTLLFIYAALTVLHSFYILKSRIVCNAFESLFDYIAVTALSTVTTPGIFANVGGKIQRFRILSTQVRVRATETSEASVVSPKAFAPTGSALVGSGTPKRCVKIHFGSETTMPADYERLRVGEAYG